MMERTDRHFRYLLRLITRRTLLYTEMIPTGALLHGDPQRFLEFHPLEHPVAVQFGGSDPWELAKSARIATDYGYDEINLNIGCPSGRVQKGRMGACLMLEPERVAECVQAIRSEVATPVSVKTRTGIDQHDSYEFLARFIETVAGAGCKKFAIHARKALLRGFSPKQNRSVPPLRYDTVFRVKNDYPDLEIVLNGGVENPDQISHVLKQADGVMIGREAYKNPFLFSTVDRLFYGDTRPEPGRLDVLREYLPYLRGQLDRGTHFTGLSRHLFGLFHACPRAKEWRRTLTGLARRKPRDARAVLEALATSDGF